MSDYTYFIFDAAANVAPNFQTLAGARNDFAANNRMGAGTGVVGSGVLSLKIRGNSTLAGTLNFTAAAGLSVGTGGSWRITADANAFNASAANPFAYSTAFDSIFFSGDDSIYTDLSAGTVESLLISSSLTGGSAISNQQGVAGMTLLIRDCVIQQRANTNCTCVLAQGNVTLRNVVLQQLSTHTSACALDGYARHTFNAAMEHVTFVGSGSSAAGIRDSNGSGFTVDRVKNCYGGGFTAPYGGFTNGSAAGNASSATDAPGTSPLNSIALSTTNFQSVTGNGDYRTKATSLLKTTGATVLGSTPTDAYAQTRVTPTTIGAFAAEAGSGGGGGAHGIPFFNRLIGGRNHV